MSEEFNRITSDLAQGRETQQRQESSTHLRNRVLAKRRSLEKRGSLAKAAERQLTKEGLHNLNAALQDDDPSVRLNAAMSAGYLGDSTTVPFLEDLSAGGNPDANSRFAAIISLGDIGGPRGAGVLSRLASDPEEMADVRFAALTALEELVAKRITSGPDRRFDPPENSSTASPRAAMDEPIEVSERRVAIVRDLRSIESDTSADDMLKLKAADVRRYLDSGVA